MTTPVTASSVANGNSSVAQVVYLFDESLNGCPGSRLTCLIYLLTAIVHVYLEFLAAFVD